jgi:WD40 repeat protein
MYTRLTQVVNIWDIRKKSEPLLTFMNHNSAVRGLDYAPLSVHILATGGGREDGKVILHDTQTGATLQTIETKDQVCFVKFSRHYNELLVAKAGTLNQFSLFDVAHLRERQPLRVASFSGHDSRPLFCATSPDGQSVCTMAGGTRD